MFHRLWCSLQKKFPELLRCYGRAGVVWHGLASAGDLVPVLMPVVASCRGKALAQKRFSLEARVGIERGHWIFSKSTTPQLPPHHQRRTAS